MIIVQVIIKSFLSYLHLYAPPPPPPPPPYCSPFLLRVPGTQFLDPLARARHRNFYNFLLLLSSPLLFLKHLLPLRLFFPVFIFPFAFHCAALTVGSLPRPAFPLFARQFLFVFDCFFARASQFPLSGSVCVRTQSFFMHTGQRAAFYLSGVVFSFLGMREKVWGEREREKESERERASERERERAREREREIY